MQVLNSIIKLFSLLHERIKLSTFFVVLSNILLAVSDMIFALTFQVILSQLIDTDTPISILGHDIRDFFSSNLNILLAILVLTGVSRSCLIIFSSFLAVTIRQLFGFRLRNLIINNILNRRPNEDFVFSEILRQVGELTEKVSSGFRSVIDLLPNILYVS